MRLSPKSVFFGLVAFGLPLAVAVGWNLAVPAKRPAAVGVPNGEGVLGAAPVVTRTEPVAVGYTARPHRRKPTTSGAGAGAESTAATSSAPVPSASTSVVPVVTTTPPPVTTSPSPTETSEPPLPPLDEPPVPTPTDPGDPSDPDLPPDEEPPSSAPGSETPMNFMRWWRHRR